MSNQFKISDFAGFKVEKAEPKQPVRRELDAIESPQCRLAVTVNGSVQFVTVVMGAGPTPITTPVGVIAVDLLTLNPGKFEETS
ncbi:MAG: hypothetical protein GY906_04840 [bacterium]|nr:hypothetical protein [bacterium]